MSVLWKQYFEGDTPYKIIRLWLLGSLSPLSYVCLLVNESKFDEYIVLSYAEGNDDIQIIHIGGFWECRNLLRRAFQKELEDEKLMPFMQASSTAPHQDSITYNQIWGSTSP